VPGPLGFQIRLRNVIGAGSAALEQERVSNDENFVKISNIIIERIKTLDVRMCNFIEYHATIGFKAPQGRNDNYSQNIRLSIVNTEFKDYKQQIFNDLQTVGLCEKIEDINEINFNILRMDATYKEKDS
jgi:hypothetical protein